MWKTNTDFSMLSKIKVHLEGEKVLDKTLQNDQQPRPTSKQKNPGSEGNKDKKEEKTWPQHLLLSPTLICSPEQQMIFPALVRILFFFYVLLRH